MIITEQITINGKQFVKHYSDRDLKIKNEQTGFVYSEAIDLESLGYTYVENDEPIESMESGVEQ